MPKKKVHRSPLEKLQRAWEKADGAERAAFRIWLGNGMEGSGETPERDALKAHPEAPLASGRYLTAETVRRIEEALRQRGQTFAQLQKWLELAATDRSLARALYRGAPLRLIPIARLDAWLRDGP